jgi:hypothetical protein
MASIVVVLAALLAAGGFIFASEAPQASGGASLPASPSAARRALDRSRPDVVPGVDLIFSDWQDRCDARGCNYLNPAAFVRVPLSPVTNATLRPGTYYARHGPGALLAERPHHGGEEHRHRGAKAADPGRSVGGSRSFQFSGRLTF